MKSKVHVRHQLYIFDILFIPTFKNLNIICHHKNIIKK